MTKRDFFKLMIKLFGLYSGLMTLFTVIPNNIANLLFQFNFSSLLFITILILVVVSFFLLLIFKTDFIIDKLKLDKGFDDEKIQFENLTNDSIVKFAVFLIGGFLIINHFPNFLNYSFQIFKIELQNTELGYGNVNYFNWIISAINILIGYLLITNYKAVAAFFDKK